MTDWQPIETAPKDGTSIFIGWHGWDRKNCKSFVPSCAYWEEYREEWLDPLDGESYRHPTHWMPIPLLPHEKDANIYQTILTEAEKGLERDPQSDGYRHIQFICKMMLDGKSHKY